jgi:hypothetical protein
MNRYESTTDEPHYPEVITGQEVDLQEQLKKLQESGYTTCTFAQGPWIRHRGGQGIRILNELVARKNDSTTTVALICQYKYRTFTEHTLRSGFYSLLITPEQYTQHVHDWNLNPDEEQPIDYFIQSEE